MRLATLPLKEHRSHLDFGDFKQFLSERCHKNVSWLPTNVRILILFWLNRGMPPVSDVKTIQRFLVGVDSNWFAHVLPFLKNGHVAPEKLQVVWEFSFQEGFLVGAMLVSESVNHQILMGHTIWLKKVCCYMMSLNIHWTWTHCYPSNLLAKLEVFQPAAIFIYPVDGRNPANQLVYPHYVQCFRNFRCRISSTVPFGLCHLWLLCHVAEKYGNIFDPSHRHAIAWPGLWRQSHACRHPNMRL